MLIKFIKYVIYMMKMRMKGFKYEVLLKSSNKNLSSNYINKIILDWADYTNMLAEITLEIEGQENLLDEPCIFISNHQSSLDVCIILAAAKKKIVFIGKKELESIPLLGYWFKKGVAIPMDRCNVREALKSINTAVDKLNNGESIAIFPEGRVNKDGSILEFKKGSFKLATKSKKPIIPVTIDGSRFCFDENNEIQKSNVKIVFGEPIFLDKLTENEAKNINDYTRNIILQQLEKDNK